MNLNQLSAFVLICKHKNFHSAANALNISQPNISQQIKSLENELGTKLFFRDTNNIVLTEAGNAYLPYAEQIVNAYNSGINSISKFNTEVNGTLTIAASNILAQYILPKVFVEINKVYPKVKFEIIQTYEKGVENYLNNRIVEIGVVSEPFKNKDFIFTSFSKNKFVLIAPNNNTFKKYKKEIPKEILEKQNFIMHSEGSYARVFAEEYFKKRKINKDDLNYVVIAQTTETIIECVANGLGLAILSEQVVKNYANKNKILVYNCDFIENRTFYITHKKDVDLSLKSKIFIDYAKKL